MMRSSPCFLCPRQWAAGMILVAAATVAPAAEQPLQGGAGLFSLRPQLPGKVPFLAPKFAGGQIPDRWDSRWRADLLHTSTLQYTRGVIVSERPNPSLEDILAYMDAVHESTGKDLFYFDGETTRLDLGWGMGMPGGWELGAELSMIRHGGGWLDGSITGFHDVTGLSDAGRDSAPDGAGAMVLITSQGDVILTGDDLPQAELGDLTLSARFSLPTGRESIGMSAVALVEVPTGDTGTLAGSGEVDLGAAFTLEWRRGRGRTTFGLGYARLGGLEAIPALEIADTWTATVAFEYRLGARGSLLGQLLHSTSPYAGLGQDGISDAAGNLAVGGRFPLGRHWVMDAALVEDLLRHNSDLDVGFLVSVAWRKGPPRVAPLLADGS